MTFVLYVSRPIFFENQCGSAEKKQTNHQKINTVLHRGNAKCDGQEAFARGTLDGTIDEKQLISNRPPSCSAAKTKQNKGRPLEQISFAAFSRLLSLSPDRGSERILTDMANKHAQESDRAMVGPPAPSSLSRSTFCPQQLSHTHTQKTFLETSPRRFVPESTMMSPSAAPVLQ